jgi:hypothetical protein
VERGEQFGDGKRLYVLLPLLEKYPECNIEYMNEEDSNEINIDT